MANPTINSTATSWVITTNTTKISAKASWSNGTSCTVRVYSGSTQKVSSTLTNNVAKELTFTGISKDETYHVAYIVTSGSLSATKYDVLVGDNKSPISVAKYVDPDTQKVSFGVAFGKKAVVDEFRTEYNAFFDGGYTKFNNSILTAYGIHGPIDPRRYDPSDPYSTRSLLSVLPTLTYSDLGLQAGANDAQMSAFMKAWTKYNAAIYPNASGVFTAECQPDCFCIVLWVTGGNYDLVNDLPRYSVGWVLPSFNDSRMFKFGTYNGTWFCYKFTGTAV